MSSPTTSSTRPMSAGHSLWDFGFITTGLIRQRDSATGCMRSWWLNQCLYPMCALRSVFT